VSARKARRVAGLALVVTLGACAAGPPPGPVVSPTGIVYPPGTPPAETRRSQTATLYLRQGRVARALDLALEGVAADSANPIHYFLAGTAYARLDRPSEAAEMFGRAERIYPAYELDIEPEREAAWAAAFNAGLEAYEVGDEDRAIRAWTGATAISSLRPQAHRNLASLLALDGRYAEAIEVYEDALAGLDHPPATRVLTSQEQADRSGARSDMQRELSRLLLLTDRFAEAEPLLRAQLEGDPGSVALRGDLAAALDGLGQQWEAAELYEALLEEEGLQGTQLFNLGVALFRQQSYDRAAQAFERLTELQPRSRDAWFNLANSLFAAQAWTALARAGARLVDLDPLNENARLITARALLEGGDRDGARGALQTLDRVPAFVDELQLRRAAGASSVEGALLGNTGAPRSPIRLRFTFYDDAGVPIGSDTVAVPIPEEGGRTAFRASLQLRAAAYSYEVLDTLR